MRLFHFSEDPSIERFAPHVPATNPDHPPAVWAIDEQREASYWFPRDCPRIAVWCEDDGDADVFRGEFATTATRLHVIEPSWEPAMHSTELYRYELPTAAFRPWPDADGQWISGETVEPLGVEPLGDLVDRHRSAGIELRYEVPLWDRRRAVLASGWPFSIIRMKLATRPVATAV